MVSNSAKSLYFKEMRGDSVAEDMKERDGVFAVCRYNTGEWLSTDADEEGRLG